MNFNRRYLNNDFRSIMSERKKLDNEIRKTNSKNAYVAYINYEILIWKKLKLKPQEGLPSPADVVAKKIINLHNRALSYFKDDLKLWLSFIRFCMEADYHRLLSDAFSRMLTYRTDKHLWLLAAKWELDEYENTEKALEYLYRALYYHSTESSIYCEIFRLELDSPKYLAELTNTNEYEELAVGKATKIFIAVQHQLKDDVDIYMKLLRTATHYNFTTKLQTEIITHLTENFPQNENVWYMLAKRELEGHHLNNDRKYEFISESMPQTRLENVVNKFQYAMNFIQTETMWSKYLQTLLDLFENEKYNNISLINYYKRACEESHKAKLLNGEFYIKWIEYLQDSPRLNQILEEATKNRPKSLELWIARIRCHIRTNDEKRIEAIFDEGINILGDNSIQLWRLKIQYYQLNLNNKDSSKVENIYRAGLKCSPAVSKCLKSQFLDWITLFKLDSSREEYKKLAVVEPFCLELHKKMIELEIMCSDPDIDNLNYISNLAVEQFGNEVWTEYVQDEIDCGPRWKRDVFRKYLLKD